MRAALLQQKVEAVIDTGIARRKIKVSCEVFRGLAGTFVRVRGNTTMTNRRPLSDRGLLRRFSCAAVVFIGAAWVTAHAASANPEALSRASASASTAHPATAGTSAAGSLPSAEARTLYTLGQLISRTLEAFALTERELEWVKSGLTDGVTGTIPKVDLAAEAAGLHALQEARRTATLARERAAGAQFVADVAQTPGSERHPSGVVIQRVQPGEGPQPTPTDHVEVHYEGTLIDGTVFDSSRQRGTPAKFPVRGVIACWTEALQVMRVGGRSRVVCPAELAYGDRGSPPVIKPGATLVFDIELLAIVR